MFKPLQDVYQKYSRWMPIVGFLAGFAFDTIMLKRIDELATILQQAAYLLISAVLISVDLIELVREVPAPRFLSKVWKYREFILHFLLGTLLNSYTIFYFKSASALTSFLFIFILVFLLTANEFMRFGKSQQRVHVALLSLCLISYLQSLVPILLGFVGVLPFFLGLLGSILFFLLYYSTMQKRIPENPTFLKTHLIYPFVAIELLFTLLYFTNAIPPVPLSVRYIGMYHSIEKKDGDYVLSYTHDSWKFWEHGDEVFQARPGDVLNCYLQIFSPSRFKDQIQAQWLLWNEKRGWEPQDSIPLSVTGGREEGYRAIFKKSNYQPGKWRVRIQTTDGREVGRLNFRVENDESTEPRETHQETR